VLEGRRRVLGESHPATRDSFWKVYDTLLSMKDEAAIEAHEAHAIALFRQGEGEQELQGLHDRFNKRRLAHGLKPRQPTDDAAEY